MQSLLPRATAARIAISTSRSFRATRAVRVAAMSSEPIFDIAVKGDPNTGVLGDCKCAIHAPATH